uniref:Uncharacterized protein n=1 Tax=Janibacter limosus TaxID=53458 RepID=A0AC61U1X4_9MICO|nr:hypothetical protein [Janibacter limosus]
MTFSTRVHRMVAAAVVGAAALTALVPGVVAIAATGSQGVRVLGIDMLAWILIAPASAVAASGGPALVVLRSIDRRRAQGDHLHPRPGGGDPRRRRSASPRGRGPERRRRDRRGARPARGRAGPAARWTVTSPRTPRTSCGPR